MGNAIQNFNVNLFHQINHSWTNPVFDALLPLVRESVIWVPLYFFLILFGYHNFGTKGLYWIGTAIITVTISNFISSDILKPYFDIPRPCRDTMLEPAARLLVKHCPGSGSFTSSHAVNHFAIAAFIVGTLVHIAKWTRWFYVWAAVICYAQVYVGVHFPIDVVFGAALGIFIGYLCSIFFNFKLGLLQPKLTKQMQ